MTVKQSIIDYYQLWTPYVTGTCNELNRVATSFDAVATNPPSGYTTQQLTDMANAYRKVASLYLEEWNSGAGKSDQLDSNPTIGVQVIESYRDAVKRTMAFWGSEDLQKWGGVQPTIPALSMQQQVEKNITDSLDIASNNVDRVRAILGNDSSQVSAIVSNCSTLDQVTKNSWYVLARKIVDYNSDNSSKVADGQVLRNELSAFMLTLKNKGCGDVPAIIAAAPPPVDAPPPIGKKNPFLENPFQYIISQIPWWGWGIAVAVGAGTVSTIAAPVLAPLALLIPKRR